MTGPTAVVLFPGTFRPGGDKANGISSVVGEI
ncbi:hypothetical protein IWQ49_003413 [Labrenzia sp. EL_126]|nr:hypothetical protein [Labrenzia sp. EL_126]